MTLKAGRPRIKGPNTKRVIVSLSPLGLEYLDKLVEKQGFGESRAAVLRRIFWNEINRLIDVKRLKEI